MPKGTKKSNTPVISEPSVASELDRLTHSITAAFEHGHQVGLLKRHRDLPPKVEKLVHELRELYLENLSVGGIHSLMHTPIRRTGAQRHRARVIPIASVKPR